MLSNDQMTWLMVYEGYRQPPGCIYIQHIFFQYLKDVQIITLRLFLELTARYNTMTLTLRPDLQCDLGAFLDPRDTLALGCMTLVLDLLRGFGSVLDMVLYWYCLKKNRGREGTLYDYVQY